MVCDGCADETASRARGAGADLCWSCHVQARSSLRTPPWSEPKARSWPSPTPTPHGSRALCASSSRLLRIREWAMRAVAFTSSGPRAPGEQGGRSPAGVVHATNQEGVYWRYEMAVRARESRLSSITAGNGAIYATRRELLHRGRSDHGPRPLVPFQHGQARLARHRSARRPRGREDGAHDRGRVAAQAAHDEPHLADRHPRRDALAARLHASAMPP